MLNSAVSLGRTGINVEFISDIADDQPGEMIVRFLMENQVGTSFLNRYHKGKTTLALAFLNKNADAAYTFYEGGPKEMSSGNLPMPCRNDIVLFGSFYSLTDRIRENLKPVLASAGKNNTMILYDPNFRSPHINDLSMVMPYISENISCADIVRGSDEDFLIFLQPGNR